MIEVEVNSIRVSLMSQHRVVLLKDINEDRYLPIFIGQYEADAISIELQDKRSHNRPLTHDLLKNIMDEVDATVVHIFINDMRRDIYFARIVVEIDGEKREIDSRPSDAIALAVRTKSPIFVSEAVMDRSAVEPDDDVDLNEGTKQLPFSRSTPARDVPKELLEDPEEDVEEVDDKQISAFSDFLSTLDLDELDDSEEN